MKNKVLSLPYLVWAAIFVVVPLGIVVFFAFTSENGGFTLGNFENMFGLSYIFPTILLSFELALIATVICLIVGYPVAYIMSRMRAVGQRTMMMIIMIPMWMNFLLRTYGWMTILEDTGLLNKLFSLVGLGPFHMINTHGAVVLGMVYNYLPFMILPLYSVMEKIDKSVIEAAGDLGASPVKVISRVVIPMSLPGIITGITMVFVPSVSTFVLSKMLGGGSAMMIGDLIESKFVGSVYDPYLGSAISLVLMVVIIVVMGIINMFDNDEMEGIIA